MTELQDFVLNTNQKRLDKISKSQRDQIERIRKSISAYLNDRLMKFRYLTKFHLQYCAVLSQDGK